MPADATSKHFVATICGAQLAALKRYVEWQNHV